MYRAPRLSAIPHHQGFPMNGRRLVYLSRRFFSSPVLVFVNAPIDGGFKCLAFLAAKAIALWLQCCVATIALYRN